MVALPPEEWVAFRQMSFEDYIAFLKRRAGDVDWERNLKARRGPKKAKSKRKNDPKHPHVSVAKILHARKRNKSDEAECEQIPWKDWSLDVAFREDDNRVRRRQGAENLGLLRRLALSLLKGNSSELSPARKRWAAALDPHFLEEIVSQGCNLEKT